MSMLFTINNSPFFGKEGKFVTSRHLRDRLFQETEKNLALKAPKKSEKYKNLYFVGGSVNPGGGTPMVVLSGQLVRDKILRDFGKEK